MTSITPVLESVLLEITNKCNLQCHHCYSNSSPYKEQYISFAKLNELVNELSNMGVKNVALSGGEPFLYPDIWKLLELLKLKEFRVIIDTNGTKCDKTTAEKLKDLKIDLVNVSLHGYSPQSHDLLIGTKGAFYRAINSIDTLSKSSVPLGINVAINRYNYLEAHNIIYVAIAYQAKSLSFFRVFPTGRARRSIEELDITIAEHKQLFKSIDEVVRNINLATLDIYTELPYIYWEMKWERVYTCGISGTNFIVSVDGSVYLCNALRNKELKCGNVYDDSLENIWKKSNIFQTVRKIREKPSELLKGKCSTCKLVELCMGGCRACAYYHFNDLYQSDPRCWLQFPRDLEPSPHEDVAEAILAQLP